MKKADNCRVTHTPGKPLCVILTLSLILAQAPLSVFASHSIHSDACYNGTKHVHSSSCEFKWDSTKDLGIKCPVCSGTGLSDCEGVFESAGASYDYPSSYEQVARYYSQCDTCGYKCEYSSTNSSPSGSSTYTCHGLEPGTPHGCDECWGTGYVRDRSGGYQGSSGSGSTIDIRYLSSSCSKSNNTYYTSNGTVASASCNVVVKSLTTKK